MRKTKCSHKCFLKLVDTNIQNAFSSLLGANKETSYMYFYILTHFHSNKITK